MRCREEHGSLPQPLQRRGAPDKRNIDVQPITALQPSQKRESPTKGILTFNLLRPSNPSKGGEFPYDWGLTATYYRAKDPYLLLILNNSPVANTSKYTFS